MECARLVAAEAAVEVLAVAGAFRASGLARSAAGVCAESCSLMSLTNLDQRGSAANQSGDKSHALHTQAPGKIFADGDDFKG